MSDEKIRFVLIGGFLGAGKTTLVAELARRYTAAGRRVGIITNDQADDLVDTRNLRSQGFQVGEVAGACFCCSFDELVATADSLRGERAPEILLAEPVGSCTDLVATVVLPLQQLLGDRFELAPFGVLLKPSHGKRILASGGESRRSGFSPQAEYIFRKQLEEADYLMIGRSDELAAAEIERLSSRIAATVGDRPIVAISPKTGQGVDSVVGYIESPMIAGQRLLEIDYDTYAAGEAELGWVNLAATLSGSSAIDLDRLAIQLVSQIATLIRDHGEGQIAHLKASVLAADTQAVANVISNESTAEIGLSSGRSVPGPLQLIVNARVALAPDILERMCRVGIATAVTGDGFEVSEVTAHALRPGRPTPTHRVTK